MYNNRKDSQAVVFGVSSSELFVIILVAVLFLGPRELIKVAKLMGNFLGKINATAIKIQREINLALARDEIEKSFDPKEIAKIRIEQKLSNLSEKIDN